MFLLIPFKLAGIGIYGNRDIRYIGFEVKTPTLAEKLGMTTHLSPLLHKAKQAGLNTPELLESLAVARGCWHYRYDGVVPAPTVSETAFSNEELALALLSPCLPYSPHTIRVGAAMLGATGNDVQTVARLAVTERSVAPVHYVASAALQFEPDNPYWSRLLERLPDTPSVPDGVMPHPTRFVSMTGMTQEGIRRVTIWIRPRPDLALARG